MDILPKLLFEYSKDCRIKSNRIPITIKSNNCNSNVECLYAVKNGIISSNYLSGINMIKVDWDKDESIFSIKNEGDRDIIIKFPFINISDDKDGIYPKVSIDDIEYKYEYKYEYGDNILLFKENDTKIMKIDYNCYVEGEYRIILEIIVENTVIKISWLKICKNNPYSYSVYSRISFLILFYRFFYYLLQLLGKRYLS